ncbi:hypothetical protein B0H14DRAFT_2646721 [Mycena olivaceomarginata]|nr:hypothetical protein B0H14DRAFT_2646721 [Mycena olivaceomarginata]
MNGLPLDSALLQSSPGCRRRMGRWLYKVDFAMQWAPGTFADDARVRNPKRQAVGQQRQAPARHHPHPLRMQGDRDTAPLSQGNRHIASLPQGDYHIALPAPQLMKGSYNVEGPVEEMHARRLYYS